MNESILTSIKAQLGIQEEYTAFDQIGRASCRERV